MRPPADGIVDSRRGSTAENSATRAAPRADVVRRELIVGAKDRSSTTSTGLDSGAHLRPLRLWGSLITIVGGAAAAVISTGNDNRALTLTVIGLTLVAGGVASPGYRWMLLMGLPFLAVGCSIVASGLVPFLEAHLTTAVFIALGASIMAADRMAAPARALAASLGVLVMAAGFIILALRAPNSGVVIPGWTFGAEARDPGDTPRRNTRCRTTPARGR